MGANAKYRGSTLGYKLLELFYKLLGYGFASVITRMIVLYYFIALPRTVAVSMRFYAAVYPQAGRFARLRMAWRQFASFATVFLDRFLIVHGQSDRFDLQHVGLDEIAGACKQGRPLIMWISHLGNWEIASHILSMHDVPISVVVGQKQGERIEKLQKKQLKKARIKVITVSDEKDWQSIELIKMIKNGQIVALAGDRLFSPEQRSIEVSFFGRRCEVPLGPYVLASLTGADLVPVFGLREGRLAYRFVALSPRRVQSASRSDRKAAMARTAGACFDDLERMVLDHPEQWYNFFDYFDAK
jgi:predicted LPLAT superfamily acyltransferase